MPGRPRKYDPTAVEHEYVTGDLSLRALAAKHTVSFSSLTAYARRQDWSGKRIAYRSALSRRTYETMAAETAGISSVIREESIKVARATLQVYAERLAARQVPISPKDALDTIRTLAELLRDPDEVKQDDRVIDGTARQVNADLLRRIADAARGQVVADGVLEATAPEQPKGTRPN